MILYSKNCDFIGIGKEELSFLGFEDIDQFREVCSDVADLFVNKPGFIYKFKNFSWIEYTLNSGAPNKNVIIKLKNGNEIETTLKIKEVFLYTPVNNEKLYYAVEFINNSLQNNSEKSDPFVEVAKQETPPSTQEIDVEADYYAPKEELDELSINFNQNSNQDIKDIKDIEDIEDIEDMEVDFGDSFAADESQVKLKINNDYEDKKEEFPEVSFSNEGSTEEYTTNNSNIVNKEVDSPIKIKNYDEDENNKQIILKTEELNNKPLLLEEDKEEIIFDVEKCAEELGLDISLIAEVINDYLENIDATMPKIQNYLDTNDEISLQSAVYSLKGISDNLHIHNISEQLAKIIQAPSKNLKKEAVEKFKIIISQFKNNFL